MFFRRLLPLLGLLVVSTFAHGLDKKTFCVWDPVGRTGPVMTFYSDVIAKAQAWGLDIHFKAYTEEFDAAEDFKKGKCQAAVLTTILSRQFVKFAGTMDAIGAINSAEGLELAIATFARSRAGNLMIEGNYEVVTTFPVGSMYAYVRDRSIDSIDKFEDKTLAILNNDPQMRKFADLAGAKKVDVTLSNFADKFNRGKLDILVMPALAYNTFELYDGLGDNGGIIDYRLYYGMLQTIAKRDQFPEDFGDNMRGYMLTRMKAINKMVKDAEEEIPPKYWIETNQFVKDNIDNFSKRVRLALQNDNINSTTALKLFWKIRCRMDPSRGECKMDFPEPPQQAKSNVAKSSPSKPKKETRRPVKKADPDKQKTLAQYVEKQKELERQLARQRQEIETLKAENTRILEEKQRLAAQNTQIEEMKAILQQERKALQKAREQLTTQQQNVEQGGLALRKQDQAPDNPQAATPESDAEPKQQENRGGFWNSVFGWI